MEQSSIIEFKSCQSALSGGGAKLHNRVQKLPISFERGLSKAPRYFDVKVTPVSGARDCLSLAYVSEPARNLNKIINNTELPLGDEAQ